MTAPTKRTPEEIAKKILSEVTLEFYGDHGPRGTLISVIEGLVIQALHQARLEALEEAARACASNVKNASTVLGIAFETYKRACGDCEIEIRKLKEGV